MIRSLTALLIAVGSLGVLAAQQPDSAAQPESDRLKAVIHVNFADPARHEAGMNNIENILKDVSDAEIEVVCHSEGLTLLTKKRSGQTEMVSALMKRGVRFVACENTMRKKSLTKDDLIEGTLTVPSGAVEVLRKQSQGYGYFRP
ncbi:MAG: DsrE family protein [Planctomycetaceae bacterium]